MPARAFSLALFCLFCAAANAQQPADFGDAPAPYPICEHRFLSTPQTRWLNLGPRVSDDSTDQNPVPGGIRGDPHDDGVRLTDLRDSPGDGPWDFYAYLAIECWTSVSGQDVLGVWMDFNDDGAWDAGEQVVYAVCGQNNQVPATVASTTPFRAADVSEFKVAMPMSFGGASVKVRVRVWNGQLSTGVFAIGAGWGAPDGACMGGECEDYEFWVDGDPEIRVRDYNHLDLISGDEDYRRLLMKNQVNQVEWLIQNDAYLNVPLNLTSVVFSDEVGCTTNIAAFCAPPILLSKMHEISFVVEVTPTSDFCSFTMEIHHDDSSGGEQPFIVKFKGACGMSGTYVVDNTPGANAEYPHIGDAFDALEKRGALGPVTITVREGVAPYVSNASCGIGLDNNLASNRFAEIWGVWSSRPVLIRAAAGERPVIEGSGARFRVDNEECTATLALAHPYISVEGLELRGGRHFGLAMLNEYLVAWHHGAVRGCRVHGVSEGPGIALISRFRPADVVIENNMVWNCAPGGADVRSRPLVNGGPTYNTMAGSIAIFGGRDIVLRHNSVLTKSVNTPGAMCAGISICAGMPAQMRGNIISQADNSQPALYLLLTGDVPQLAEHNCYHVAPGGLIVQVRESSANYTVLTSWQGTGTDQYSVAADPKFRRLTDPVDLHLKSSSTLIDAIPASTLATDVDGEVRPQRGAVDIGADEVPPDPAMSVRRGAKPIADGGLDVLGAGLPPGVPTDFVYTIYNNGQGVLRLTGTPRVVLKNLAGCVASVSQPPAMIGPMDHASFTVTVTAADGACSFEAEIFSNDPVFDTYNWRFTGNDLPVITVSVNGTPVAPGAVLKFGYGTAISATGLQIHVANENANQLVTLFGNVANGVPRGMINAEFSHDPAPAPYIVSPASGTLDEPLGSSHLVTLTANDGYDSVAFTFTLEGERAVMLLDVLMGGTSGAPLSHNTPASGERRFAIRDVKAAASAPIQFTLRNGGSTTIPLTPPYMGGPGAADFKMDLAGFQPTLPPGGVSMFYVSFDPRQVGTRSAWVILAHQATNQPNPFEIPVEGPAVDAPPLVIAAPPFAAGKQFAAYAPVMLAATGGLAPYTWAIHDGSLPEGLTLSAGGVVSGVISGGAGEYYATVRVNDILGNQDEVGVAIQVKVGRPAGVEPSIAGRDGGAAACGAADSHAAWLWLLAPAWLLLRRRRAKGATCPSSLP